MSYSGSRGDARVFREQLLSRSPFFIEREAFDCPETAARRQHLLYAAACRFAPRACHELVSFWRKRADPAAPKIAAYWHDICEWLPLQKPSDGSAHAIFLEGCRLEHEERNLDDAMKVYLRAAEEHPLAAARLTFLGGFRNRLLGWMCYSGRITRSVVALQCLAVAFQLLNILIGSDPTPPNLDFYSLAPKEIHQGLRAAVIAVSLGCAEGADPLFSLFASSKLLYPIARESALQNLRVALHMRHKCQNDLEQRLPIHLRIAEQWSADPEFPKYAELFAQESWEKWVDYGGLTYCSPISGTIDVSNSLPLSQSGEVDWQRVTLTINPVHVDYTPPPHDVVVTTPSLVLPVKPAPTSPAAPTNSMAALYLNVVGDPDDEPLYGNSSSDYAFAGPTHPSSVSTLSHFDPPAATENIYANVDSVRQSLPVRDATVTPRPAPGPPPLPAAASQSKTAPTPSAEERPKPEPVMINLNIPPYRVTTTAEYACTAPLCPYPNAEPHPLVLSEDNVQAKNRYIYMEWVCTYHKISRCAHCFSPERRAVAQKHVDELRKQCPDALSARLWMTVIFKMSAVLLPDGNSQYLTMQGRGFHAKCTLCEQAVGPYTEVQLRSQRRILILQYWTNLQKHIVCAGCHWDRALRCECKFNVHSVYWSFYHQCGIEATPHFTYILPCLHALLNDGVMTTQQWRELYAWFGPLTDGRTMFLRLGYLCAQPWFYGRLGTAEAAREASSFANLSSSWLFRFSTSELGGFAFTVLGAEGKVTHYRVSRDWENSAGEYVLRLRNADKRYATLTELLAGAKSELRLETPISGSPLPRDIRNRRPDSMVSRMVVVSLFEQCRL